MLKTRLLATVKATKLLVSYILFFLSLYNTFGSRKYMNTYLNIIFKEIIYTETFVKFWQQTTHTTNIMLVS